MQRANRCISKDVRSLFPFLEKEMKKATFGGGRIGRGEALMATGCFCYIKVFVPKTTMGADGYGRVHPALSLAM